MSHELPEISNDSSESSAEGSSEGSDSEDESNYERQMLFFKHGKQRCDSGLPFTNEFAAMRLNSTSSELPRAPNFQLNEKRLLSGISENAAYSYIKDESGKMLSSDNA